MKCFLEYHPGLEFLKAHPDFQDKYGSTVVMRIFYISDLNDDGKITDNGLMHIKNIHSLDLHWNTNITDDGIKYLSNISLSCFKCLYNG